MDLPSLLVLARHLGVDEALAAQAVVTAILVLYGLYPAVKLRRRAPSGKQGEPYVPKALWGLVVGVVVVVGNALAGFLLGRPLVHAVSAGLSAAALAMFVYSMKKPRGG